MNHGLSQQDMHEIISALRRFPDIEEALLFGSRAKGNFKPGSDIDIAIKGRGIKHSSVTELSYILNEESILPYFFDIVHFEQITEQELLEHIQRVGLSLYERKRDFPEATIDG